MKESEIYEDSDLDKEEAEANGGLIIALVKLITAIVITLIICMI